VIQKSLSFWQILLAHGQDCAGYFEIRAVVVREFLHLLFRSLDLLRSGCLFSEQDQSWSVVRRLFQNLCRFLERLLWLVYPDEDERKPVATV
jgi:hypothetical protein